MRTPKEEEHLTNCDGLGVSKRSDLAVRKGTPVKNGDSLSFFSSLGHSHHSQYNATFPWCLCVLNRGSLGLQLLKAGVGLNGRAEHSARSAQEDGRGREVGQEGGTGREVGQEAGQAGRCLHKC